MSDENRKTTWGLAAALGAAVAASACCTLPLLLVALGVGGAWIGTLTALEPYRPVFIVLALGALGYAGYREWRMSRGPDCDCEVSMQDRLRRTLLGLGLVAVLGLIASPWIIGAVADTGSVAAASTQTEQVVLEVEGMTCAACNVTVQKALTNLDGVKEARVTFTPPQAVVTYDPSRVTVDDLVRATTNVGYPSKPKQGA
ncbi:cation transporter [Rhodocaloribacter litoris]|uniref:mercuric transporter MerT family protein n=1 Tax=Rhodocaloribacter litoris TaxID=2558931 RepID=UPI001422015A|nr:mercuric transporter MerT family protein [Rhodocaloribacter litoris]QXD14738.1 cation transporter [Rhodocaloribacter litoris]GIV59176.1 MAG: hypothetical protein KatS3mg043_0265 [Rhodothermaceae bacterium]